MRQAVTFAVFLLAVVASDDVLLKRGWYRTHSRGRKITLNNVEYFNEKTVPDSHYLRIGGRIPFLFNNSVRDLKKVVTLKFVFCGLTTILPGAFQNVPNLATLALLDNEIEHVRSGVFNDLNIITLYLQRNQITTIDSSAFDNMPKLYRVKLNSNKISAWDPNWFHNSPSVTEILVRRNEIQEIPSNAFKAIKGSHTYNGTYLIDTKIYLSKNSISHIAADAFQDLTELSQLWLDRNQLTSLDEKVFSNITQISTLFLSKNKLRSLPNNMFPNLKSDIDILDVAGNNNMTCLPYSVVSVVKMINIENIRKLDCECVEELIERLSKEKKLNEVKTNCEN